MKALKLEYRDVSNPRWIDATKSGITVDLIFPHLTAIDPKYETEKIAFTRAPSFPGRVANATWPTHGTTAPMINLCRIEEISKELVIMNWTPEALGQLF